MCRMRHFTFRDWQRAFHVRAGGLGPERELGLGSALYIDVKAHYFHL